MTILDPELDKVTPERILELRKSLKMSGQTFGEALGFAPGVSARMRVSEIETGRKKISRQAALIVLYLEAFGPLME